MYTLVALDGYRMFTGSRSYTGFTLDLLFGLGTTDALVRNVYAGLQ